MRTRTVYINEDNKSIWDEAVEAADKHNISLSTYIAVALEAYALTSKKVCPTCAAIRRLLEK